MTENQRPRVRTIKKAIAEIRAADPETAFTEGRLRKMIRAGTVPALKDGQRYLVDMNVLYAVIGAMPTQQPQQPDPEKTVIVPVETVRQPLKWVASGRGRYAKIGE